MRAFLQGLRIEVTVNEHCAVVDISVAREDCETLSFFNKRSETFLRNNEDKELNYETKILSRITVLRT
jgi:hypothetical protein